MELVPVLEGKKVDILNRFDDHGQEVLRLAARPFKDEDYLYLMSTQPETSFRGFVISGVATIVFGALLAHKLLT